MVFIPDLNPRSLLLFYERGSSGGSWCLRDYSVRGKPREWRPSNLNWSANQIRSKARLSFDAPTEDINRLEFWNHYTISGNRRVLESCSQAWPTAIKEPSETGQQSCGHTGYPVINLSDLRALPKGRKPQDMDRILTSGNSEDWVTWNLLNLMQAEQPNTWLDCIFSAARNANPEVDLPVGPAESALLVLWQSVPAPRQYESASRARMRESGNVAMFARSLNPKPVEGASEIDVSITTASHVIFVEAKLSSDVALSTTYDPGRNQIIRNIDCVLDRSAGKTPMFWMFVRNTDENRGYSQLIKSYRERPELLCQQLPHRSAAHLTGIAKNLTLIRWQDLGASVLSPRENDNEDVRAVKHELRRRIQTEVACS